MLGTLNDPFWPLPQRPPTPHLGFGFCESSNPFCWEGGGPGEQLPGGQRKQLYGLLCSSPQGGSEEGPEPSHPSEPCVLEQNLQNDEDVAQPSPEPDGGVSTRDSGRASIRSSQWSFSTISNTTQRSYNACCSWTQHPLIQKNCRVVLASFLLLLLGLGEYAEGPDSPSLPLCRLFPPDAGASQHPHVTGEKLRP